MVFFFEFFLCVCALTSGDQRQLGVSSRLPSESQVVSLGGKYLYLMSRLAGSSMILNGMDILCI